MKICGLAVFKGDKFIGELDGIETISHLIISNKFKSAIISIPSPFSDANYVSLYVSNASSNNKVKIVNGSPYVTCDVSLSVRVLSASSNSNYLSKENIALLTDYSNSFIKAHIEEYLYKTAVEFKSDVSQLGKYAVKNFDTIENWRNYNWLNNYQNSFFKIKVNTKVKSSYLIMEN